MFGRNYQRRKFLEVLIATKSLLESNNTMAFDGYIPSEIAEEIGGVIRQVEVGEIIDRQMLVAYFAPTSVLQECAMANGWHDEYISLSSRFDALVQKI